MKKIIPVILIITILSTLLSGCAKSPEKMTKTLKDKGYETVLENTEEFCKDSEEFFDLEEGSFTALIKAEKEEDYIYIYYCKDEESAKKVLDFTNELKEDADPEDVENSIVEQKGNIVYLGTEQGYKDIK